MCLRGLSDLNRDLLNGNNNPNLRTLSVYVPTLGAVEDHVPEATDLVTGGNATHYWEETGIIGNLYEEPLGIPGVYAWDVWLAYKPGALWTEELPPEPDFAMHQLSAEEARDKMPWLDSAQFTEVVNTYLAELD